MTSNQILDKLKEGNQRFVNDNLKAHLTHAKQRDMLKSEQFPHTIILSCSDSRTTPEILFDTELGELFVIRVAGNIANKSTIASIEFAISNFSSKLLIVLGHQDCGAIIAALQGNDNGPNLNYLIDHIKPAILSNKNSTNIEDIVKTNAVNSSKSLIQKSDIIQNAIEKKQLKIVPAYYSLETGEVNFI